MAPRLYRILVRLLLLPVMPCFMWGPVTHSYIAHRAFRKAKSSPSLARCREILDAIDRNPETYLHSANGPDAIAANHVLYNIIVYDYAHNNIPNRPDGTPIFGYRLVAEALDRLQSASEAARHIREEELAFACGWLTHQLSDWIAHYKSIENETIAGEAFTFYGYANSHQVLSPCFHPDILRAKREAEHVLTETLHDAHIMFSDSTGLLCPGRNRVHLVTELDDNPISNVSATFGQHGFSKIPAGHLAKLKEDFDLVIDGIESCLVLVRAIQPGFVQVAKEFSERNQRYVEESVDRVLDELFVLTREEIARRAGTEPRTLNYARSVSVVKTKEESLIQRLAFRIGGMVTPDVIEALFAGPVAMFEWDIPGPWDPTIKLDLANSIKRLLPRRLDVLRGRAESTRALVNFAEKLLSASGDIMGQARDAYCTALRPVTDLDEDRDPFEPEDDDSILERMVSERRIRIRFTPAQRTDKKRGRYLLDPDTAVIRINGYLPDDPGAPFTLTRRWGVSGEILHCEIDLDPKLRSRCIHLFADIRDRRGEHSQYIDKQVRLC
jgi:hypothetical protein